VFANDGVNIEKLTSQARTQIHTYQFLKPLTQKKVIYSLFSLLLSVWLDLFFHF